MIFYIFIFVGISLLMTLTYVSFLSLKSQNDVYIALHKFHKTKTKFYETYVNKIKDNNNV